MTVGRVSDERGPGEEGLAFFGRVVAGQCHELVNVLNVVNELSGLQSDTLPRARRGDAAAVEKLGDLAGRIQAQVKRGEAIIRTLRHFAHSVDEPWQVFDAREAVDRAVRLASRQARLRQTELVAVLPDAGVALASNPFWLQHAVYVGIELLLEGAAAGRRIAVTLAAEPAGVTVTVEGADPAPRGEATAGRLAAIGVALALLGGALRAAPGRVVDDRVVLFVPDRRRGQAGPAPGAAGADVAGGGS